MKILSLITQFKIEFSLLLIGWRKVLGKMPENAFFLTEYDRIGLVITK